MRCRLGQTAALAIVLIVMIGPTAVAESPSAPISLELHGDLTTVPVTPPTPRPGFGKRLALLGVAGVYAPFVTWAYFAWFRGAHRVPFWFDTAWSDEKLGLHTYAGGADKFGHTWFNYALTRGTTELLVAGGWSRWGSSLACAGLAELWFTMSEIKDGYVWGFEVGDIVGNVSGAILGVLMENIPALDRLFDFRLEYFPSPAYRRLVEQKPFSRGDGLDISQDYSGQSYMLALHLGQLPHVVESRWLRWVTYVDLVAGFESRNYEPAPLTPAPLHQTQYLGLAVNMQAVLSSLLRDSTGRRIGRGVFEVYSVPLTTLRFAEYTRSWTPSMPTTPL